MYSVFFAVIFAAFVANKAYINYLYMRYYQRVAASRSCDGSFFAWLFRPIPCREHGSALVHYVGELLCDGPASLFP